MKDQVNNGGPAFPAMTTLDGALMCIAQGMTLRDYFAAKADVSAYDPIGTYMAANGHRPTVAQLAEYITSIRLAEADAMLRARGVQ